MTERTTIAESLPKTAVVRVSRASYDPIGVAAFGPFAKCQPARRVSAYRGRPEVVGLNFWGR